MSPEKGFMFNIRPTRVSLVKRPANRREFLVMKSEEELVMDEIIQIITKTTAENEDDLVAALEGKDEGTIQAALSVYRTLSAFRDSLSTDDFGVISKALEVEEVVVEEENIVKDEEKADEAKEEIADETEETVEKTEEKVEDTEEEVEKGDTEADAEEDKITKLEQELATLKAQNRVSDYEEMVAGLQIGKSEGEMIALLKDADATGSDIEALVESWTTASDIVKSAMVELGTDLHGDLNKNAGDSIDAEAQRIAKEQKISVAQAYKLVDPETVRKYYD